MFLDNYMEERKADKIADKLAADLFMQKKISVRSANHVYLAVKKIILELKNETSEVYTYLDKPKLSNTFLDCGTHTSFHSFVS